MEFTQEFVRLGQAGHAGRDDHLSFLHIRVSHLQETIGGPGILEQCIQPPNPKGRDGRGDRLNR